MTAFRPLVPARGNAGRVDPAAWVKRGKGCPARLGHQAEACVVVVGGRKANPGREAH
jgi:hypothetical protein